MRRLANNNKNRLRVLFGSNLLALTWIKGEQMPRDFVDEVLRGLGLGRASRQSTKLDQQTSGQYFWWNFWEFWFEGEQRRGIGRV